MAVIILPLYKGREFFFDDDWNGAKIRGFFPQDITNKAEETRSLSPWKIMFGSEDEWQDKESQSASHR